MLILTRKPGESLYIGDTVKVTIVEIKGHQIRVGIDAPTELRIYREEIYLQILEENRKAADASQVTESALEGLSMAMQGGGDGGETKGAATGLKRMTVSKVGAAKPAGANPEVVVKRKKKEA